MLFGTQKSRLGACARAVPQPAASAPSSRLRESVLATRRVSTASSLRRGQRSGRTDAEDVTGPDRRGVLGSYPKRLRGSPESGPGEPAHRAQRGVHFLLVVDEAGGEPRVSDPVRARAGHDVLLEQPG